jgi:hypothetical protein
MLAYTDLTELFKLPSPAHLTAVPRASPNQAHSTVADQRRRREHLTLHKTKEAADLWIASPDGRKWEEQKLAKYNKKS